MSEAAMAAAAIPDTMQCIVCHGPGDYRCERRAVPEVGREEVLVKVLAVGICAGDAKCFAGAPYYWGSKERARYVQPPMVVGHEFVGEVVKLGEGAAEKYGLALGDLATSENIVPCWECRHCKAGRYNLCQPHDVYGWRTRTQGAMSQYMKYPWGALNYKVPRSIPAWQAAFIEPLACSVHAVELGELQLADSVVVSGCGPLGLGMVAAARLKNPRQLIALDLYDWKLEVAKKCGADVVLNPSKCDVVQEVRKLTDGFGCDVYIEATGHPQSVKQGLAMVVEGGRFVEYGVFVHETATDWGLSSRRELKIVGGHLAPGCYPKAIEMIAKGLLPLEEIVTHKLGLRSAVDGIRLVTDSSKSLKVVLIPNWDEDDGTERGHSE